MEARVTVVVPHETHRPSRREPAQQRRSIECGYFSDTNDEHKFCSFISIYEYVPFLIISSSHKSIPRGAR